MVEISLTRVSSKGQIVIPQEVRESLFLKEGDKILIIKNNNQLILKKAEDFDKNLAKDLEFAKRTEQAYKRHEQGEVTKINFNSFIKEKKKW